jgi:hypothetical protein
MNENVARGAAILDELRPGWYQDIDLEKLDLISSWHCVLGQLYGHFGEGLQATMTYRYRDGWGVFGSASAFGFMPADGYQESRPILYELLKAEWTKVIIERRTNTIPDTLPQDVLTAVPCTQKVSV